MSGLKEHVDDLRLAVEGIQFATDSALKSLLEFEAEALRCETIVDRINLKTEKLKMDATSFLATIKQIDDVTNELGASLAQVSARMVAIQQQLTDSAGDQVAVDAAVQQLAADATKLASISATLKQLGSNPANPVPPVVDPPIPSEQNV